MKFTDLNFVEPILDALRDKGYESPTPIQEKAIPSVLEGRDVLGCAQTGTGKTAAFALPIVQRVIQSQQKSSARVPSPRALIVTPTRELAIQIDDNIKSYSKYTDIKHTVIFGGVKQGKQVDRLNRGIDILTATPGRLLDLINQRLLTIEDVEFFVLDEADRMLDMGFIHDIKKLLQMLPSQRQSLFFSATMPSSIVKLSSTILTNPIKVEVAAVSSTAETIEQHIYYTNKDKKRVLLKHIIEEWKMDQVLVFSRTKHGADRIARDLKKSNINAAAIHGDKAQNNRQKVLQQFKDGRLQVLVATDIAARGIDIDKLRFVVNFDVPNISETYVHRIGRSGRAGEEGVAIAICEPEENAYVRDIEKLIGKKIDVVSDHPYPQTDKPMTAAEKKEWEKEKQRRKQEFFANRKAGRNGGGKGRSNGRSNSGGRSQRSEKKDNNQGKKQDDRRDNKREDRERSSSDTRSEGSAQGNNKKRRNNNKKRRGPKTPQEPRSKNDSRTKLLTKGLRDKFMFPLD